ININIPIIKTNPNITSIDLKKYTYKRSEFTTNIASSNSARKYNIRKALNNINGTHLSRTQKFSFNNIVGKRTADKGYKSAKVILDGEFVEGVGGGVCQVSSTLYNAVLLAGLNVISSQKHSKRVNYVKAGFDAMVNYGTSDLVFENNTEGDIYILCKYSDASITISIYGADLKNISYDRCYEIVNPISAKPTQIVNDIKGEYIDKVVYEDECFELKKSHDGYTIKSYLIEMVDGIERNRKLLRVDKYLPQQGVLVYGSKPREVGIHVLENIVG
ncbi:MAG: VanW family protein, partial [Clostridia bacterium]